MVTITPLESRSSSLLFPSYKEGCLGLETSIGPCSIESTSSHSDGGEYEQSRMIHFPPPHRNFPGFYSFMSKPVYPVPFPAQAIETEGHGRDHMCSVSRLASSECRNSFCRHDNYVHNEKSFGSFSEFGSMWAFPELSTSQRERTGWERESPFQAITMDMEYPKSESSLSGCGSLYAEGLKCGICERWLAQRSPWSSHRMIKCGDFPASGVLSCGHVYHADCLEQTIPESQKHDPPCPSCGGALKIPSLPSSEQSASVNGLQMISASGSKFPRFRIATDADSPSSSENRNYIHSDYMTDASGRKWHIPKEGHGKKSFLSKRFSRRHFFKSKSLNEPSSIEHGPKSGGSCMHIYHGNRLTGHFPTRCSRG